MTGPDSLLSKAFAMADGSTQAALLNDAGRNLRRVCGEERFDAQCCFIVDDLNGDGRDLIKRLAAFIAADEQTPRIEKRTEYVTEVVKRRVDEDGAEVLS